MGKHHTSGRIGGSYLTLELFFCGSVEVAGKSFSLQPSNRYKQQDVPPHQATYHRYALPATMTPRLSIAAIALLLLCCLDCTSAFIAPTFPLAASHSLSRATTHTSSQQATKSTSLDATRRNFIDQTISTSITAATSIILFPAAAQPALAKGAEAPEITPQTVKEAFDAIRNELTSSTGVVATLSNLIDNGSFEDILQYTKESDAYFRKAKLGKACKLLTDKDLKKGEAVFMSNAVTFDLIGINRASRPGKESREDQLRYLEELKKDIEKFLELEKTIVFE